MKPWNLFLLLLFYSNFSIAGLLGTWEGDYVIHSQADANNFVTRCNCEKITGSLTIYGSDIEHLDSLYTLKEVQGSVYISSNDNLINCDGLNAITNIGKDLLINSNPLLDHLNNFEQLKSISGKLEITDNNTITAISSFNNLEEIANVEISENRKLKEITDFDNILFIDSLAISNNTSLKKIDSFKELIHSTGNLLIENNDSLHTLSGFENLKLVDGDFTINKNYPLRTIPTFNQLQEVIGQLSLHNIRIREFPAFEQLTYCGGLSLKQNWFENINGFNALTKCGNILIGENRSVQEINGFKQLLQVNGNLDIQNGYQKYLKSIKGFCQLEEINGWFRIILPTIILDENYFSSLKVIHGELETNYTNFQQLDSLGGLNIFYYQEKDRLKDTLSGFSNLKSAGVVKINEISDLKDIAAFPLLKSVHRLQIHGNRQLTTITGFNSLTSVKESLHFSFNTAINELHFFNQLKSIQDRLSMRSNFNLTSISGFKKLQEVNVLYLENNNSLVDFDRFNQLASVQNIYISNNLKLEDIPNFDESQNLSELTIIRNPSLIKLPDFNHFTNIGQLEIRFNTNLVEVSGFNNLVATNKVHIDGNANLLSLNGFAKLNQTATLRIQNMNLRNLEAFTNLSDIERLYLMDNIQLRSMDNFANLINISDTLVVTNNLQINQCCLVNCWLDKGVVQEENISIDNNGSNCMNLSIIKSECETTDCSNSKSEFSDIQIIVNPVFESLQFAFVLNKDQLMNYKIYTINDQLVSEGSINGIRGPNNKTINFSHLQKGHYFLVLHSERFKEVVKFIKL